MKKTEIENLAKKSSSSPLIQTLICSIIESSSSFVILNDSLDVSLVTGVTLLNESKSETLTSWEGDDWLFTVTNNENVGKTSGEAVTVGVFDVGDFVGAWVMFDVLEDANTTDVVTASGKDGSAVVEFDDTFDFTGLKVKFDRVVLLDVWMGEADGSAVVGDNIGNLVLAKDLSLDLAEFECGLFSINAVRLEASLNVEKNAEELASLLDGNDILEPEWESWVSPNSVVNLDIGIFVPADSEALLARESVLKSVAEQHRKWDAFTQFVGAS